MPFDRRPSESGAISFRRPVVRGGVKNVGRRASMVWPDVESGELVMCIRSRRNDGCSSSAHEEAVSNRIPNARSVIQVFAMDVGQKENHPNTQVMVQRHSSSHAMESGKNLVKIGGDALKRSCWCLY